MADASVSCADVASDVLLLDAIATAAPLPSDIKQELLEDCDEASRASRLADLLATWAVSG
jgi:hypothetical protein